MRRRGLLVALVIIVAAVAIIALAPLWLAAMGNFLVRSSTPIQADMIVVLAGDPAGLRILKAAELVKQGYAPKILVSGPYGTYGEYESEPEIRFAVRHGYPEMWFVPLHMEANSTVEEVAVIVQKLREWKIRRVDVVTSNYHSRRAGVAFRRAAQGIEFRIVAAPDRDFRPDDWWKQRPARKTFAIEWMKTLASWVGL